MNNFTIDPITFELVRQQLNAISNEMMITIQRTGRSPTTTQAFDFSASFMDQNGNTLDQAIGVPLHMGTIPSAMKSILDKFRGAIDPNDILIMNDPYTGGMHLPDIYVVVPITIDGEKNTPFAYAVSVVHHVDVGGRAAGSMAHDSTEIYQEGLRIPPLKLFDDGNLNKTLVEMIRQNARPPDIVIGDIMGQVAACRIGAKNLHAMIRQYGPETLQVYFDELRNYSERITRKIILTWPNGIYQFTDYVDDDGLSPEPIPITATITIKQENITVDYSGSSAQVRGAINCSLSQTQACAYVAIRSAMGVDIPNNDGCFRPITVIAPKATITNMQHPAACASRGVTAFRIIDATLGALAQALPDKISAACEGGTSTGRFGFTDPDGNTTVFYDNVYGVQGALPECDGISGVSSLAANLSNVSIEMIESNIPVRIGKYTLVPDSGGPGKYRGGQSIQREWQLLQSCNMTFRSDRRKFPPYGLNNGLNGKPSNSTLIQSGSTTSTVLPTKINRQFNAGDIFMHTSPGGGGHGHPYSRDPKEVLRDWIEDRVTIQHAKNIYGVVIDKTKLTVNYRLTKQIRLSGNKNIT